MNLQLLVSLPYRCYIPNFVKIGPVVLEKMLTDNGCQPIEIDHMSYSGDLKIGEKTVYIQSGIPLFPTFKIK